MNPSFELIPEAASSTASHLDHLTAYLLIVATIFTVLIFACILRLDRRIQGTYLLFEEPA